MMGLYYYISVCLFKDKHTDTIKHAYPFQKGALTLVEQRLCRVILKAGLAYTICGSQNHTEV